MGILAGRAIRMLCPECKEPVRTSAPAGPGTFAARGCEACGFTGFRGFRVLTDAWVADAEVRRALRSGAPRVAVARAAREAGTAMREQGLALVQDGLTSLEELSRTVDDR